MIRNINTKAMEKIFLEWQTPAYRKAVKSKAWYLLMGLILAFFIAYDLFTGGYIVSITFLLLAGVYYVMELKPVPVVKVVISEFGVTFGAQSFPYSLLKSFWILSDPGVRSLHIKTHKGVVREVVILIPDEVSIVQIREYLRLQLAEEEGKKESFSDELIRNLGL